MVDLVAEWPAAVYLTFQRPLRSWQRTPAPCFRREMPPRPSHCEGGRTRWRESGAHLAITRSFLLSELPERQISSSRPGNRFPLSRIRRELLPLPGGWFLTSSQPDRKHGPTAAVEGAWLWNEQSSFCIRCVFFSQYHSSGSSRLLGRIWGRKQAYKWSVVRDRDQCYNIILKKYLKKKNNAVKFSGIFTAKLLISPRFSEGSITDQTWSHPGFRKVSGGDYGILNRSRSVST